MLAGVQQLTLYSGDVQFMDRDTSLVLRDMYGTIEISEFKHEEPWLYAKDKFIVDCKDDSNYILPVRILPGRVLAAAMADGTVVLIELENRRTTYISQGE